MEFESKEIGWYQEIEHVDTQFNEESLSEKLYNVPTLHSKWLRFCYGEIDLLLKMEKRLKEVYREKYEFYMTEYKLQIKPAQANIFVESDSVYGKYLYLYNKQKMKVEYLEKVVKKINSLSFDMQNIIKWNAFKNGVNL